jgi:hypothetical protein
MAGLDPAIHPFLRSELFEIDARVEPAHDVF